MKSTIKCLALAAALLLIVAGCEYDGPTAMWDRPYEKTTSPVISSIDPQEAVAGVNRLTILGEGFAALMENNKVYVDGARAEILESTTTSIKIRRPAKAGEATTIKVVNVEADDYASYSPYKIVAVEYIYTGGFMDGSRLIAAEVDKDENVYLVQHTPRNIYKITPSGEQTIIGQASRTTKDVMFAPDGQLVLLAENRVAYKFDPAAGTETEWFEFTKRISFGDFDANGIFYTGGRKTGLWSLTTGMKETDTGQFDARQDDIQCLRVFNNALYALAIIGAADENTPAVAIWKCPILDAAGNLGPRELVLDWSTTGAYAESIPVWFTFSADGSLIVATDNANPLLIVDTATGVQDILYKDILGSPAIQIVWGNGNYLYMVQGTDSYSLRRIDTGRPGAPYFGRE